MLDKVDGMIPWGSLLSKGGRWRGTARQNGKDKRLGCPKSVDLSVEMVIVRETSSWAWYHARGMVDSQLDHLPASKIHMCKSATEYTLNFSTVEPLLGTSPVVDETFWSRYENDFPALFRGWCLT